MTAGSARIRSGGEASGRDTARVLRAVRTIRRARGEGGSRGDVTYAVYAGVLLAAIVGFPVLRAVVLYLAAPPASAVLVETGPDLSAAVFALACAGFVALGGVRGPAALSPFAVFAVAGNGHPRRRTLLRPVVRVMLALALLGAGLALLVSLVLVAVGSAAVGAAVAFSVAGALAGVVCGGCWVLGQRASGTVRAWIVGGVLATWVLSSLSSHVGAVLPWGWFAAVFPVDLTAGAWGALGGLGVLAVLAVATVPVLLDGLRGPELLAQALRWQTAGTLAFTGDLAMAMGEFRAVPRRGRRLAALGGGGLLLTFVRRDLVGSLRTPVRFGLACAGCLGFGLLLAVAIGASGAGVWLAACSAAIVGYLALGVWSDGFRHVAEVAGSPPLYGVSPLRLLGLHAVLPVVGGVVFAGAGAWIGVVLWGGSGGRVLPALAVAMSSVLLLVLVRIYDSAKGPLPLVLMAPVPTPAGDASALVVAAWQADAVILACAVVGAAAWAVDGGVVGVAVVAAGSGVVVGYLARRRVLAA